MQTRYLHLAYFGLIRCPSTSNLSTEEPAEVLRPWQVFQPHRVYYVHLLYGHVTFLWFLASYIQIGDPVARPNSLSKLCALTL